MEAKHKPICPCGSEDVRTEWLVPFYEDVDENGNGIGEKTIGKECVCNACGGRFTYMPNSTKRNED